MGFAALPYNSIKMALVAKEVCRGNCHEQALPAFDANGEEHNKHSWS
jgi:hypothetical protein